MHFIVVDKNGLTNVSDGVNPIIVNCTNKVLTGRCSEEPSVGQSAQIHGSETLAEA